jgi:predicted nucleic acid-binding protein
MNYMLDASALIAFLNGEGGKPVVKDLLTQASEGDATVFMCVVNFTEVYYDRLKLKRPILVEEFLANILLLPITIIETLSKDIAFEAGRIKASHKMSLADSFLLATATAYAATVVTSDYGELEAVQQNMPIPFLWIRPKPEPKPKKDKQKADLQTIIAERDKAIQRAEQAERRIAELEAKQ